MKREGKIRLTAGNFMKKIIDLAYGSKIFNGDELRAREMLGHLVAMLPEARRELAAAYHVSKSDPAAFRFVVEKLHDGLLYVGAPALRHATHDLLVALDKKENHRNMRWMNCISMF